MANKIVQRLIAAGATPQRAQQFATAFAAKQSASLGKPQKLDDAFDAEIAAISQSIYPSTFRPPRLDDPDIDDYIISIYGEDKFNLAKKKVAPNYLAAEAGWSLQNNVDDFTFEEFVVNEIQSGTSLADAQTLAASARAKFKLKSDTAKDIVDKIYKEFAALPKARENILSDNKYYEYKLPDPKFKYGTKTNYKLGTIDARTIPNATKYLEKKQQEEADKLTKTYGAAGPQSSAAAGITAFDTILEKEIQGLGSGRTPFFDEVKRREQLKGKTLK